MEQAVKLSKDRAAITKVARDKPTGVILHTEKGMITLTFEDIEKLVLLTNKNK